MRVSSVSVVEPYRKLQKGGRRISNPEQTIQFKGKGNLKTGDYIVGEICGTAAAAVGLVIGGPLAALALGILGGKTSAEANNKTRKDND